MRTFWALADAVDVREGLLAYDRYHNVMKAIAQQYEFTIEQVTAVFCALSPNNDYDNNLRSTISVLHGIRQGWQVEHVEVSTYRHCLLRAWKYAFGLPFLEDAKGLKIRNFYMNCLHPDDTRWVTIDGHMVAIWRGKNLTMKEAICRTAKEYNTIADATKKLAFEYVMRGNQMQATLWFVRKRHFNIKQGNASQYDLLMPADLDMWRTHRDIQTIKPFPKRDPARVRVQTYTHNARTRVGTCAQREGNDGLARLWSDPSSDSIG